jgi:hypothetical protein
MKELVGAAGPPGMPGSGTPEAYIDAAEELLGRLLREGCMSRGEALDLLVADALVTAAFETGGDDPERVDARADWAMRRIASLGER